MSLAIKSAALVAVCAVLAFFAAIASAAQPADLGTPTSQILTVRFVSSATGKDRSKARKSVHATLIQTLAAPGLQQIELPAGSSQQAAADKLRTNAAVDYVELPGTWHTLATPNDPYYAGYQWSLNNTGQQMPTTCTVYKPPPNQTQCQTYSYTVGTAGDDIRAQSAWDLQPNGNEPVGVVDTGIAWLHQDLAPNIWTNPAEVNGTPGVDDDAPPGTGYVDDLRGWNFVNDNNDPRDPNHHGTHVAGIIGATSNNLHGISGVNPTAPLMALRAGDANGDFTWPNIGSAFTYAIRHGVRVINGSFGGVADDTRSAPDSISSIIAAHPEVLFVFAAGNFGANHDQADGANHFYPCDLPWNNIICVAATDSNDVLATYSDYGHDNVDIAAPGSLILSTYPDLASKPVTASNLVSPIVLTAARHALLNGDIASVTGVGVVPSGLYKVSNVTTNTFELDDVNTGLPVMPTGAFTAGGSVINSKPGRDGDDSRSLVDYHLLSGTSMAAPFVSGAVSLLWSTHPTLQSWQVKSLIVQNTDFRNSLNGKIGYAGRLNLFKSLVASNSVTPAAPSDPAEWPITPAPVTITNTPDQPSGGTGEGQPVALDRTSPSVRLLKSKLSRVGKRGVIKFKLRCSEFCKISISSRVKLAGARLMTQSAIGQAGHYRVIQIKFSRAQLSKIRMTLLTHKRVKLYVAVQVADSSGNKSTPRLFSISIVK